VKIGVCFWERNSQYEMLPTQANSNQVMLRLGLPAWVKTCIPRWVVTLLEALPLKKQFLNKRVIDRIGSMHGIFLHVHLVDVMLHVGNYTIDWSYGNVYTYEITCKYNLLFHVPTGHTGMLNYSTCRCRTVPPTVPKGNANLQNYPVVGGTPNPTNSRQNQSTNPGVNM